MRCRVGRCILAVSVLVFAAFSCRPGRGVLLDVEIVEQPVGGRVGEVSCTFRATARNTSGASGRLRSPITVRTCWKVNDRYLVLEPVRTYQVEEHVWHEHDEEQTITSSMGASQLKEYRFVIEWTDDRGRQKLTSEKVYVPLL